MIIRNASVLNQEGELETRHIVVQDGIISAIESNLDVLDESAEIIEAEGKLLIPGLIDMHVHLREPGFEHKETVETEHVRLPRADLLLSPACRIHAR